MKPYEIENWQEETESRVKQAVDYFMEGYNCAQSVAMSMADYYDISPELMARIAASFGAGIGRMRQTCGTACGMFILAGMEVQDKNDSPNTLLPTTNPYPSAQVKKANYQVVQRLAEDFKTKCGSIICADLLGLTKKGLSAKDTQPTPEERTPAYYAKRPCARMVEMAVRIYMHYLEEKYNIC